MPAQPLLRTPPLVDEVVSVVDKQLQIAKRLLIRARPTQPRLAQGSTADGERVDRVRLPTRAPGTTLRRHQLRRHPHQLLADGEQLMLERASQLPTILERPQALTAQARRPPMSSAARSRRSS